MGNNETEEKIMKKLTISLMSITIILCGVALCIADDYGLESIRCGSEMISIGALKSEVLSSCGTPTSKSLLSDSENWIYNFGPTDYVYTLNFYGEQLNKILQGDRGY
jgi:hypothetical protein